MPTVTDRAEASHTAGRISNGAAAPLARRTPATVVGSSWIDAVFSTTSRHSSSLATPSHPAAIRRAARMPSGVAALPRPSRFAETLAETAASVSPSRLACGRIRRKAGRSSRASPPARPQRSITSITPVHRHTTPAIDRHSSTADRAPSSAAAPTCAIRPVSAPKLTAAAAITVQTNAIAISSASLSAV